MISSEKILDCEFWKEIKGFENYKISSLGRVISIKTNRIMKQFTRNGYFKITLSNKTEKNKKFTVHRLVAEAFLEDFDNNLEVDHIDRVKSNNKVDNLRCVNRRQNTNNQSSNMILKLSDYLEKIANEQSIITIEELLNYFKNNNMEINMGIKFISRLINKDILC